MANKKISAFPTLVGSIVSSTMRMTGLRGVGSTPSNVNFTPDQIGEFVTSYIASLGGFTVVGTGAQYQYQSQYQAWQALKGSGMPVRLFVANDITEDGNIAFDSTTPPLITRCNAGVTIDYGVFKYTNTNDANIKIAFEGEFYALTFAVPALVAAGLMDFASIQPASIDYSFKGALRVINNSDASALACSFFATLPGVPTSGSISGMEIVLPPNSVGYSLFTNCNIDGLKITGSPLSGSDSAFDMFGTGSIRNLVIGDNFFDGAVICQFEKNIAADSILNVGTATDLRIVTQGGSLSNVLGSFNIEMRGSETDSVYPVLTNANDAKLTISSLNSDSNAAIKVVDSYIRSINTSGAPTSGIFSLVNTTFASTFTDVPAYGLWKFTACHFEGSIETSQDNTLFIGGTTGKTNDGAGTSTITVSGGNASTVIGCQTRTTVVVVDPPATATENVSNQLY